MTSKKELLDAVKEALQKDGHLGKIRAELRTAVLNVLENKNTNYAKPKVFDENELINNLIREYLEWNGYKYTAQMLIAESGQSMRPTPRRELSYELGVSDDQRTEQLPFLYSILSTFKNRSNV